MYRRISVIVVTLSLTGVAVGQLRHVEVSDDGHQVVFVQPQPSDGTVITRGSDVPYGSAPDWANNFRVQVGAIQVADMNNDGWDDVVLGCYHSNSFPPYPVWRNYIYYNTGGQLEATPSWVSDDEVSTGDIQVGDFNGDGFLDIFAANGGFPMDNSVIYFGGPGGPSPTPGWVSNEPGRAWNNYALLIDIDHDGDLDVMTANQGNSEIDPYRPMYLFRNHNGTLETTPSWASAEWSIQNFLAAADYDGDGWEEIAVSKWVNFESGIYDNLNGTVSAGPVWTTGDAGTDKGVAWGDFDANGWPDLVLGHDAPTRMYANDAGTLTLAWESNAPFFSPNDYRVFDVDGDGDLDLAETHFADGRTHIYINRNGILDSTPTWTYDSSAVGTAVAYGDINGDGAPDLVIGYSGDPSVVVFYNQRPPCPADLNGDGVVDVIDLSLLLDNFGTSGSPASGDLDGDGDVDLVDLSLLLGDFGTSCN